MVPGQGDTPAGVARGGGEIAVPNQGANVHFGPAFLFGISVSLLQDIGPPQIRFLSLSSFPSFPSFSLRLYSPHSRTGYYDIVRIQRSPSFVGSTN